MCLVWVSKLERRRVDGSLPARWLEATVLFMPRGGATAYGSRVVCVSVRLSVRSIFYKTALNQLLKTAILA